MPYSPYYPLHEIEQLAVNAHGYKPLVPIIAFQFADAKMRNGWIRDKEEYAHALVKPLQRSVDVRFVSIATLIDMKTAAGRQQDLIDVEHLRMRLERDAAT